MKQLLPIFAVILLCGADSKDADKKLRDDLRGTWVAVEQYSFGEKVKPNDLARMRVTVEFDGTEYRLSTCGRLTDRGQFAAECSHTPVRLTVKYTDINGQASTESEKILIEVGPDQMRLSMLNGGWERQIDPESKSQLVLVLKRKK
jgi:uncharacterized protein (TIGR03067 family)